MGLIQHKQEAFWFDRFVSIGYDNFINPFFWDEKMLIKAKYLGVNLISCPVE